MATCHGITTKKQQCKRKVASGEYCYLHKNQAREIVAEAPRRRSTTRETVVEVPRRRTRSNARVEVPVVEEQPKKKLKVKKCKEKKYEQEKPEDCPVCYDKMDEKKPLSCGHWVHRSCVEKSRKKQCPICRSELALTPARVQRMEAATQREREQQRREQQNIMSRIQQQRDSQNIIRFLIYNGNIFPF